jgi:putative DNA primase/helicase
MATAEYRDEEDQLARFIAECCLQHSAGRTLSSQLYGRYRIWAEQCKESAVSLRLFGEYLGSRYEKKTSNGVWYLGITLAPESDPESPFSDD